MKALLSLFTLGLAMAAPLAGQSSPQPVLTLSKTTIATTFSLAHPKLLTEIDFSSISLKLGHTDIWNPVLSLLGTPVVQLSFPSPYTKFTIQINFNLSAFSVSWKAKTTQAAGRKGAGILINSLGARCILIPAGSFQMGAYKGEKDARPEEYPQHKVTLTKPFYLGQTEVTQGQWYALMKTTPWKNQTYVKEGASYPATWVSWNNAVAFCQALSKKEGVAYRLPTEAEWEYACRAGTTTRFSYGDDLTYALLKDHAWYNANALNVNEKYAHLVAQKMMNRWGLYDMHGNVWEWCSDWWYWTYPSTAQTDPQGPSSGRMRVIRGGSWFASASLSRTAYRTWWNPADRYSVFGFRVATLSP